MLKQATDPFSHTVRKERKTILTIMYNTQKKFLQCFVLNISKKGWIIISVLFTNIIDFSLLLDELCFPKYTIYFYNISMSCYKSNFVTHHGLSFKEPFHKSVSPGEFLFSSSR